jgi:5-(carboxyamino)imidazole ribonucleotide synthase
MDRLPELMVDPANALPLYGKAATKAGRKMGHVTRIVKQN